MCVTCGCGDSAGVRVRFPGVPGDGHQHSHEHPHDQLHDHSHEQDPSHGHDHPHTGEPRSQPIPAATRTIDIEQELLAKNDSLAEHNRGWLAEHGITAINLMSSPGSGKTSLLERTIREAGGKRTVCVIEGDQETLFDAERIRATGAAVIQVNTGAGCHLDADMLRRGIEALAPPDGSLLLVENVGNLVCPALFDLGESAKVVVISVTEGADKPLKYPHMFAAADLIVINKIDLLPYVDFDLDRCRRDARSLRPDVDIVSLSVKSGAGIDAWYEWIGLK
ncbi:MAG: hydrogenase nickel incorporation protein HypB [Geodermatophilaceae bacterium]|nr:hydrogenase nickel incorporation protein HypB [Geodermatophilaceae bacterium]